ncbi:MAG TPA: hypothetical protein VE404_00965, partial [Verrucomicrobiae bacterium]|nr:hypothetical protein [Verrucomicrobiae bacterium]
MRRATLAFALVVGIPSATSEAPGSPIPIAGEFQVSTDTSTPARFPQIAMARGGAFMVVWEAGGDGS